MCSSSCVCKLLENAIFSPFSGSQKKNIWERGKSFSKWRLVKTCYEKVKSGKLTTKWDIFPFMLQEIFMRIFFWHQFDTKKIYCWMHKKHFLKAGYILHIIIISSKSSLCTKTHCGVVSKRKRFFSTCWVCSYFMVQRHKTALFMILWIAKSVFAQT